MVVVIILALVMVCSVVAHIKDLGEQVVSLRGEISRLTSEKSGLVRDLDGVKSENGELTHSVEAMRFTVESLRADRNRMLMLLQQIHDELKSSNTTLAETKRENEELTRTVESLKEENITLRKSLTEAPLGFPSLLEAIRLYDEQHDEATATRLESKSHPAYTAAQTLRTETQKRRDAEYESRKAKLLLDYYFNISPDAQELSEASEYTPPSPDNNDDTATRYLSREEYLMLSITERNQLALDRFWNGKKSKQVIGRLYEQYVGYRYELNGWIVEYFGISEGFSDLGRDLIYHRDNTTLIIQCKNWSKSKRIYEKHIFQLLGTTHEYFMNHQFEDIRGVFYTSTQLSDLARSFAKEFRIELHEGFELQRFPMIKCNIGREGEKIYHLPFDQQYYSTRINPHDGDTYCTTVAEAEAMGFRRAYRWHRDKQDY